MLKEYLIKKDITVYKLCKISGVPYSTLNDLVNFKLPVENIRAGQLKSIANALDVGLEELYDLCLYRKSVFSKKYNVTANAIIKHKSYYIVFDRNGKQYCYEVIPAKKEATTYIEELAVWKLNEEISKLELEAAYEFLHS